MANERTLVHMLEDRANGRGDAPWIVSGERRVTYAGMAELSARVASGLAAVGIGPGDTVALLLDDPVEFIGCWCGLARLGAIEVPVNANLRGAVLAHVLDEASQEAAWAATVEIAGADLPG